MSDKPSDELKPCPFCGGEAEAMLRVHAPEAWVRCMTCHASTDTRDSDELAATAWNTRAQSEVELEMLEALQGVYARCCGEYPGHPETLAVESAIARATGAAP